MTKREAKRIAYHLAWRCLSGDIGQGLAYYQLDDETVLDDDGRKIEEGLLEIVDMLRHYAGE